MDTGADISIIKINNNDQFQINSTDKTTLSGIGNGTITSLGSTYIELQIESLIISHKFQIVQNSFPIPCDGLIGMDFLSELNCKLDFNTNNDFLCLFYQQDHK